MIWPPQNTGRFAVPVCVQCCSLPVIFTVGQRTKVFDELTQFCGTAGFSGLATTGRYRTETWGGMLLVELSNDGVTVDDTVTFTYSGFVDCRSPGSCASDGFNDWCFPPGGGLVLSGVPSEGFSLTSSNTSMSAIGSGDWVSYSGLYNLCRVTGTATSSLSSFWTMADVTAYIDSLGWDAWDDSGSVSVGVVVVWDAFTGSPGVYQPKQFRIRKNGYSPSSSYECSVEVYRKPIGGSYALYATLTDTVVSDSNGLLEFSGDVPNAEGYETWIKSDTFLATPA